MHYNYAGILINGWKSNTYIGNIERLAPYIPICICIIIETHLSRI